MRFGLFSQVNKWDRENATKQYMDQLRQFANAYSNGNKAGAESRYASFLSSPDQSLAQDADLLRAAIDNGDDYATTLGVIAQKKQEAIKQTTGFGASMKYLGNMMKSIGASLMTAGIYAAISYGISKAVEWADSQVNAAKYAKEALQEVSSEWDELAEKQESAGDLVAKYEKDYERLSKGVNMVTGENLSLTDDEYELFKQINTELADSALASVEGVTVAYDAQGQAIVRLSGQMDSLGDAYKQLEQQARTQIINELPEVLANVQKVTTTQWWQNGNSNPIDLIDTAQQLLEALQSDSPAKNIQNLADASDTGARVRTILGTMGRDATWSTLTESQYLLNKDKVNNPVTALQGYISQQQAVLDTTLAPIRDAFKTVVVDNLAEEVPSALRNIANMYADSLSATYFQDVPSSNLIADAASLAQMLSNQDFYSAIENLYDLQTQFATGDISYGDYMSRATTEANKFVSDKMPDLFEQLIMEAFGLEGASSYNTNKNHLKAVVSDYSDEWVAGLTSDQLSFANSIDTGAVMTQTEFMSAYAESVAEAAMAVSTLSKNYTVLTEAQATAAEILANVGVSGALTLEQYEKLIEANKDYADAIDTSTGYLTVNWQKLREINKAQLAQQEATHREALAANLSEQTELRSEFDDLYNKSQLEALTDAEAERLTLLEKELNVLIEEGNQLKTNLSNIKYMNSAYKQWRDAQEAGEKSDAFVAAKEAIEQIREGDKSGRRNTNKYQAALEYILGDAAYRAASKVSREVALDRAESWYDDDGNFDLSAFRKSSIEAGAQTKSGTWTVGNIADYAKLMGVSQEYMAQAILALSEYNGFEGVNVSKALQDQAKELLPVDPVDANTEAIVTNTEALNQVAAELQTMNQKQEVQTEVGNSEPIAGVEEVASEGVAGDADGVTSELQKTIDALLAIAGKNLDLRIQQTAIDAAAQLQSVLELLNEMPEDGYTIDVKNGSDVADAQTKLAAIDTAITNIKAMEAAGVITPKVAAELTGTLQTQWDAITRAIDTYTAEKKPVTVTVSATDDGATKTIVAITEPKEPYGAEIDVTATDNASDTIDEIAHPKTPYKATVSIALNSHDVEAIEAEIARLQKKWAEAGAPESDNPVRNDYHVLTTIDGKDYEVYYQRKEGTVGEYEPTKAVDLSQPHLEIVGDMLERLLKKEQETNTEGKESPSTVDQQLVDSFLQALPATGENVISAATEAVGASFEEVAKAYGRLYDIKEYEDAYDALMDRMLEAQKEMREYSESESGDSATDAEKLEAIVAAAREANGDLSEALNQLGITYQEAGALYSNLFKVPEDSNPYIEFQKYIEQQTGLEVLVGANTDPAIQTADAAVDAINKKTAFINVKTRLMSSIGGLFSFAKGTRNAPGGLSMVGEAGDEIVVDRKDGTWFLAHYPQLVDLNPGDIVLNNEETQRAMKGKQGSSGRAYALGTLGTDRLSSRFANALFDGGGGGAGNTNGTGDDKKDSYKDKGPNYDAILEKFEQLHDWIERALEVAQKKTQEIIDNVKDFVGYIAQNKQVDKALQSTRKEIDLNQQAYVRYMQQAADVQDQLDLSDEIVQKIHEGVIDIESYDETTQKKIAEYQEWYEKAENCKDAIEELKDQERELQLQRMDNIIEDYENRLDHIDDQSAKIQREIEYQKAVGIEVQESSYEDLIKGEQKKVAELQRERAALEYEFNALVASGVIEVGSEDWHKYRNEIEGVDEAIHDATISAREFADEIFSLNLSKLQNLNKVLQSIQSSTEGIMSLHDAQGTKNVSEYYETLILNGHDQIANLEEQNDLIREQMKGLDKDSEKYQELLDELTANEEAITGIKVSQEQWNDSIADLKISSLQDEREALEKTNEEYQKQLDLEEALEALAKAKNQRTKLVYREGRVMPLYAVMRIETSQSIG